MAKKIDYASMYTLRKDGRYQGYWHDALGARHTICDRDPERLHHRIEQRESRPPLTFQEIADAWHYKCWEKLRAGTQSCYEPAYRRAVERFGTQEAASVQAPDLYRHLCHMKAQGYSAKTIKIQRTVYRQIFQNAVIDPLIGAELRFDPTATLPLPDNLPKPAVREAPDEAVVAKIRAGVDTAYWGLFAFFLICTGLRRGEALAIQWQDIDFKAEEIHCEKSVTHRGGTARLAPLKTEAGYRTVPLLPVLAARLQPPKGAKPTDYVFFGEDPSVPIPQATYNRRWMHYCKDQGFVTDTPELRTSKQGKKYVVHHYRTTLTAHVLRHGYATVLYESGVDVYTAQRLCGHASVETTLRIYTHLRQKKQEESIARLKEYTASLLQA